MAIVSTFARRGIVEGFFGPLWSMAHRKALFDFGAARGMNTYLYAPKDDPYHRARWTEPYPRNQWTALLEVIRHAQKRGIDFVYGFHPGKGLCFIEDRPVDILLAKAGRFYDVGVRTFAVLFDDIPSRLEHARDCRAYKNSLARAQATWLAKIQRRQPSSWKTVQWWICPSYYSPDPLLARVFGAFEANFLDGLAQHLPADVACLWTGPAVVPESITLTHVRAITRRIGHRLILWDNYPVNDLSMRDELHIGPLQGRDPRLPQAVYGYLNNPLLQPELGLLPLATCFDYAADPPHYDAETSWRRAVVERYGRSALPRWQSMRGFFEMSRRSKKSRRPLRLPRRDRLKLQATETYIRAHRKQKWAAELEPWRKRIVEALDRG